MDGIYKTLILDDEISLTVIESTDCVNKAIKYHKLTPLTAAALGRTMNAALYMASNLKNDTDKLSITVSGDGVGGHIIVSSDSKLRIRGYIDNPQVNLPLKPNGKLDVASCVGKGKINVVRSMGLKEPYTGSSEIVSGELAEDFSYYYAVSEQEPTAMALGVKTSGRGKCVGAGAVIIQAMPFATDENLEKAEKIIMNFGDISTKIETYGAQGVIDNFFSEYKFEYRKPEYKCICSKRYIDKIVLSLGKDEAVDTVNEQGELKVECQYCDRKYSYSMDDIEKLFNKK